MPILASLNAKNRSKSPFSIGLVFAIISESTVASFHSICPAYLGTSCCAPRERARRLVRGALPPFGLDGEDAEDDGYVVTLVTDSSDWSSYCLIFDATDVAAGPMARVTLPQRVPFGFHASWAHGIRSVALLRLRS